MWANSSWAVDTELYRVLIIGYEGRAALYDIRMGAPEPDVPCRLLTRIPLDTSSIQEETFKLTRRVPLFKA